MNEYCWQDCKHKNICKLNQDDTPECRMATPEDDLIFGMTFEEIRKKQQKED